MVEAKLAAARVATLFRFARQVYIGGAAAGALLLFALWAAIPAPLLVAWFCALLGGMLVRFLMQASFARAEDRAARALVWEQRFAIATLAIGAVWAFVPAALFPDANGALQMVVLVVVSGVVMAGAGLYAASPRSVHAFVLPPMASMIVVLAMQPGMPHRMLAVAMVVFTFVTLRVAQEIRRSLVDALRARLEQEADTDRRVAAETALRENEERLRLAVDAAGLAYWEWDRESGMIASGGALHPWSEYRDRVHPDDRERYLAAVEAAWKQDTPYAAEYRVLGADGRVQWISARGKVLRDASGRGRRMIGVAQDVSERRQQDETVRFLAYHDALTGLPNRRLLEDRLQQAVYRAHRQANRLAVLLIDLDDFKRVNDSAGHRAGDAVLREVALRLAGCVRKADTLARHGGDEFVVVMGDLAGEAECQAVAEKILRALAPEIRVDDRAFILGASIGIAVYPEGSGDADALLRNADAAMYRAKQLGRNHYRFHGSPGA